MSKPPLIAVAILASLAIAGAATAATDTLSLTGTVADSVYGTLTSGGISYSEWMLPLDGLGSANALTVSQGDQVNVTVVLDQKFSVTVPSSINTTFSDLVFNGILPSGNLGASGTTTFFNGLMKGASASAGSDGTNGLAFIGALGGSSSARTIIFDSISLSYGVTELSGPAILNSAAFYMLVDRI